MPYPTWAAGQKVTAQNLRDMQWQSVDQGTQQDVTSSIVLVNSNLSMTAVAGATYLYRLLVSYLAASSVDLQLAWTAPTNGSVARFGAGIGNNSSLNTTIDSATDVQFRRPATTSAITVGGQGTGAGTSYHEHGTIIGGDGGLFVVQFAQGVSNATASSLTSSSRLDWIRIG